MRKLKQIGMAVVLTLAFGTCAFADGGIIGGMPAAPPQPAPSSSSGLAASVVLALVQIAVP